MLPQKKYFYFILEQNLFPDWTTKDEPESDHGMDFDNFNDFKEDQYEDSLVKKTCTVDKVKVRSGINVALRLLIFRFFSRPYG